MQAVLPQVGLVTKRRDRNRRPYQARTEASSEVRTYIQKFWTVR